jgi:hypothetical protein
MSLMFFLTKLVTHGVVEMGSGGELTATSVPMPPDLQQEFARRQGALERWRYDLEYRREEAERFLDYVGMKTVPLYGESTALVRSHRDVASVRLALRVLDFGDVPIRPRGGDGIPRRLQGQRAPRRIA